MAEDGAAKVGKIEEGTKVRLQEARWDLRGKP